MRGSEVKNMEHPTEKAHQLATAKARLVEQLLKRKGINAPRAQEIPRKAGESPYALSFAQQRLWFLHKLETAGAAYHIPTFFRVEGRLDLAALGYALDEIVRRHEALRTVFREADGEAAQFVLPPAHVPLPLVDLEGMPPRERELEAARLSTEEAQTPFDLTEGPLLRARLLRLAPEEHVLLLTMHHIVSDGWSMGVLSREVVALYAAHMRGEPSPLEEIPLQYADFAAWQREWLTGDVLEAQLSYWRSQLAGAPAALELPTDRPRPAEQTFRGSHIEFALPADLTASLRAHGRSSGATLFMTLLAGFQALLSRYAGQEDLVVGTPIANRARTELEPLIGFFVNTLALRTNLSGDPTFHELLARVREVTLGAYAHQDVPFERLVEELQPERDRSRNPLFQVMFALQNAPVSVLELPGLTLRPQEFDSGSTRFDLECHLREAGEGLRGLISYSTDLFDEATVQRLAAHFQTLLEAAAAAPATRVSSLPLLKEDERRRLLVEWNDTAEEFGARSLCVHRLFEEQAARTPEAAAVRFGGEELTYAELNRRADRLARHLRALGVGPDEVVGVCLERSFEMVLGVLGVLKAGGAYMALDPQYPAERLRMMIEDAGVRVLLTQESLKGLLPCGVARVVLLDDGQFEVGREDESGLDVEVSPDNLAYIIYTSGSTGRPKGVAMAHRPLANLLGWQSNRTGVNRRPRTLQFASLSFDVSFQEIFSTLCAGATLVLIEEERRRDAGELLRLIDGQGVERLFLPFVALQSLAEASEREGIVPRALREVITAGEQLKATRQVRALFAKLERCVLDNQYGPSECHVVSAHMLEGESGAWPELPPIGRPVSNARLYLLDARLEPVPVGVRGELYIGGECVARGYLNRPALTAEKFVPDPFSTRPGGRMYRTGDLARHLEDGKIEFLGRADSQVKVRGFRIELGEIESELRRLPSVRDCVVAAREDTPHDKRLVAYLVTEEGETFAAADLRARLKEHLPDYMIPSAFVTLERLPLTPSGKVDRRALPAPDGGHSGGAEGYVMPRTFLERQLAAICEDILGRSPVGTDDDFFNLGGHSLTATRIVSRVYEELRVRVTLRSFFADPTVRGLAAEIERQSKEDYAAIEPAAPQEHYPVSHAQKRLWILDRVSPGVAAYNLPAAYVLEGALDRGAFEAAFRALVARHESLRTTFALIDGEPRQIVHPPDASGFEVEYADLRGLPDNEVQAREAAREAALSSFDLERGPLLRARLIRLADSRHLFLFTVHHIVSDGWSMTVLVSEVLALYTAFREGRDNPLPPLRIQYKDFAVWQERALRGGRLKALLGFWADQVGESPPVLALPLDFPRPPAQTFAGDNVQFQLGAELVARLKAVAKRQHATLFALLLSAYNVLLHRVTGQRRIILGTSVAGRNQRDLEPLIGFFVNTLPLSTEVDPQLPFDDLLHAVQQNLLAAFEHQEMPFDLLVQHLRIERDPSVTPIFQGRFVFNDFSYGETLAAGAKTTGLHIAGTFEESVGAKFDLSAMLRADGDCVACNLEFRPDLFKRATIERIGRQYLALLEQVAASPERPVGQFDVSAESEREEQRSRKKERQQSALSLLKKSKPIGFA